MYYERGGGAINGIHIAEQAPHENALRAFSPATSRGIFDPVLAPRLGNENDYIFISLALRR